MLHADTEQPVGLMLILLPDSHPQVRTAGRKTANERMSHRGKVMAEQLEAARMRMLITSISGWEWMRIRRCLIALPSRQGRRQAKNAWRLCQDQSVGDDPKITPLDSGCKP